MNKLLTILGVFLLPMLSLSAQDTDSHWTVDENQWPGETVLYCDLVPDYEYGDNFNAYDYELAAFIDGELRAVGKYTRDNHGIYFIFRVKGSDSDNGKTITFKAYNTNTLLESELTVKESPVPVVYDGETQDPGTPSNLRHLYLKDVTEIYLPKIITVNLGETINLLDLIECYPEGAALTEDAEYVWDYANSASWISVENNQLTGLQVRDEAYLGLRVGNLTASAIVKVVNYATSLSILDEYKEITVNKGDSETLTQLLSEALVVTPANTSDQIVWSIADESIVKSLETSVGFEPIAGGTTTMTAQIFNNDGSVRLSATLTVHVVVPVESITFAELGSAMVGDDITELLYSRVTILPEDATNKGFHFIQPSYGAENVEITTLEDGTQKIVIVKRSSFGTTFVVVSDENSSITASKGVIVNNDAQDVSLNSETLHASYAGENIDFTSQIIANVNILPSAAVFANISVTSDNVNVLTTEGAIRKGANNPTNLVATIVGAGEATVTLSFSYRNYLADNMRNDGVQTYTDVEKSFKIIVSEGVSGFDISMGDLLFGEESTISVTPMPEGAEYDPSLITVTVRSNEELPEAWTQTVTGGTDADGVIEYSFSPFIPGPVIIEVAYNGVGLAETEGDVGVPFNLDEGWQWRSLYYGDEINGNLQSVFNDDALIEVRSQYELLYNDANYGYFGDLTQLLQYTCYKIKMNEPSTYTFYNGTLPFGTEVNLNYGWTWSPNPFMYARTLNRITGAVEGDRIVSKDSGFAEFDGDDWVGSLQLLEPGQGYLYYTENTEGLLGWEYEFDLLPQNDVTEQADPVTPGNAKRRFAKGKSSLPWSYDASLWRDNMSITAVAENIDNLEAYSVGAFVNGECRGEGVVKNGRIFITVHGKAGELVNFQFYNTQTGEFFNADQSFKFQNALGSLKAPAKITKADQATAISGIEITDHLLKNADIFDLSGRKVTNPQRGIYIINGKKAIIK